MCCQCFYRELPLALLSDLPLSLPTPLKSLFLTLYCFPFPPLWTNVSQEGWRDPCRLGRNADEMKPGFRKGENGQLHDMRVTTREGYSRRYGVLRTGILENKRKRENRERKRNRRSNGANGAEAGLIPLRGAFWLRYRPCSGGFVCLLLPAFIGFLLGE